MSGNITEHATNNIDAQHSVIALGPQVRLPENTHGAKLQAELMQLIEHADEISKYRGMSDAPSTVNFAEADVNTMHVKSASLELLVCGRTN